MYGTIAVKLLKSWAKSLMRNVKFYLTGPRPQKYLDWEHNHNIPYLSIHRGLTIEEASLDDIAY
jgi:hypothetical protein